MIRSQIDCVAKERQAWLASQSALMDEIRELQSTHRDSVAEVYKGFVEQERHYWHGQRQQWHEREAALLSQLGASQPASQQQQQQQQQAFPAGAPAASPSSSGAAALPAAPTQPPLSSASKDVADVVMQFATRPQQQQKQQATPPLSPLSALSGAFGAASTAPPPTAEEVPAFARAIAAAMAAVEHVDVLQDTQLSNFMSRFSSTPSPPPTRSLATTATTTTTTTTTTSESPPPTPPATPEPHAEHPPASDLPSRPAVVEFTPIETVRAPQKGPPPLLRYGDNDIYWVGKLHSALASHGFYTSDEEEDDFLFGESTQEALCFFQASVSLPESGIATHETWEKLLLGTPEEVPAILGGSMAPPHLASHPHQHGAGGVDSPSASKSAEGQPPEGTASSSSSNGDNGRHSGGGAHGDVIDCPKDTRTTWPVVRDGDGGWAVHALQVALSAQGYCCDDDERQWWQCGSSTITALLYFQACAGLPETGVCAEHTWRALLAGADGNPEDVTPAAIDELRDGVFDEDLSTPPKRGEGTKRFFLLGEERWTE